MTCPADLGPLLVADRAKDPPTPWKQLEVRHELGRSRLHEIYRAELDRRKGNLARAAEELRLNLDAGRRALAAVEAELQRLDAAAG